MRSQLYVALDQGYIAKESCEKLCGCFMRLSVMISNLIDYLKRSGMKGAKYNGSDRSSRSGAPKNV